jgi:hypothetical protein
MKTISKILAIILFFSFNDSIIAQKKTPLEILGIKMLKKQTVKVKSNKYKVEVYDEYYNISNEKNVYENVKPNYSYGDFEPRPLAELSVEDLVKLRQFANDLIGNYVYMTPKTWDFQDFMYVEIYSDMQGNIKDVAFSLPSGISIPIEVIEQLEVYIKNEMKLHFKIDHRNRDANYMAMTYRIEFEPMRKAREKKVK